MGIASQINTLSPREREILIHIAEGDSLPEIANKLHRSLKTIESHRLSLGRKLNASNRLELAKIAIASGLISVPGSEDSTHGDTDQLGPQELAWIKQINDTVYAATGKEFLQRFCRVASTLPGIEAAAICTEDYTKADQSSPLDRIIIASARRGTDGETVQYHASRTPCQEVIRNGSHFVCEGVIQKFPEDPWLKQLGAESYFGTKLPGDTGLEVGGIALVGQEPMANIDSLRKVVNFFAPRMAGALQTLVQLQGLRLENQQLQTQHAPLAIHAGLHSGGSSHSAALAQTLKHAHHLTGVSFLRGIIDAVCDTFGTQFAGICELNEHPEKPQSLASVIYRAEGRQQDPIAYEFSDTPCMNTLEDGLLVVPQNACAAFPKDAFFVANQIQSYVGVRLTGPSGQANGVAWLVDSRPLEDGQAVQSVMSYFAPRIGAELHQFSRYMKLLQDHEELECKLASLK